MRSPGYYNLGKKQEEVTEMVMLYALSTCPWCKKTKKLLSDNSVAYDFVDVDLLEGTERENALQEVEKISGGRSFPVLKVGNKVVQGFDPDKIMEAVHSEN
ncbi:MAG TPA: glutaredoxin family protein [Bacillota bacterium]|nr:glutaredoxin family protein [Bacillota bacterium]